MKASRRFALGMTVFVLTMTGCSSSNNSDTQVSTTSAPTADATPTTTSTTVDRGTIFAAVFNDGRVQPSASRRSVRVGETVTIEVSSEVADEIHVHGYDKSTPVPAGGTGQVTFVADVPGVFEVELEHSGKELLQLQVSS